jgi:hypothetical protein
VLTSAAKTRQDGRSARIAAAMPQAGHHVEVVEGMDEACVHAPVGPVGEGLPPAVE